MKGVSSIVAVVLLIAISTIGSVGIFYWAGGMATKQPTPQTVVPITATLSGNGKILIANLGTRSINTTTFRTTDPHLWVTMCDSSEIAPHTQTACDLLGPVNFDESKLISIWGDNTGSVLIKVRSQDVDRSLIGWWSFDDINGSTVPDDSGNGLDGTIYNSSKNPCEINTDGCAQLVDAVHGKGIDLDGNQKIVIPFDSIMNPKNGFTAIAWVKSHNVNSYHGILSRLPTYSVPGWNLIMGKSGGMGSLLVNSTGQFKYMSTNNLANETWYLVATAHHEPSDLNMLYINGTYSKTLTWDVGFSTAQMNIGTFYTSGSLPLNGTVDDAMYFARPLSADEIEWLYNYGLPQNTN